MLVGNPELGRGCDEIRPGLRRIAHGRHVVFYRRVAARFRGRRVLLLSLNEPADSGDEGLDAFFQTFVGGARLGGELLDALLQLAVGFAELYNPDGELI
jgi:hypothetical protein